MTSNVKETPRSTTVPVMAADFDAFMAKATVKDRTNIARYLETVLKSDARAVLWKRLFCVMAGLSPHALRTTGQLTVQFFVADGKHRLQVFALEDAGQGTFNLYLPDSLAKAVASKLLSRGKESDTVVSYPIRGAEGAALQIESLSAAGTINAAEFFKHMLGWNRKAIRIFLPVTASEAEIQAAEMLCVRGAESLNRPA